MRRRRARPSRLRDYAASAAFLLVAALTAAWLARDNTTEIVGRAIIADGDSLEVAGQRIRLEGIDAPEFEQNCEIGGRSVLCGVSARNHLRSLAAGGVRCQGWERDRFDRLLARCSAGGRELNRSMVADGWAVSYGGYEVEDAAARRAEKGMWAGRFMRPRDWRREHMGERADAGGRFSARQALAWIGNRIDVVVAPVLRWVTGDNAGSMEAR